MYRVTEEGHEWQSLDCYDTVTLAGGCAGLLSASVIAFSKCPDEILTCAPSMACIAFRLGLAAEDISEQQLCSLNIATTCSDEFQEHIDRFFDAQVNTPSIPLLRLILSDVLRRGVYQ
jgi:hypothetical protein